MSKVEYKIVQYSEGQKNPSKGVSAGMWAVVRITEEDFAFSDTEHGARAIMVALKTAEADGDTTR